MAVCGTNAQAPPPTARARTTMATIASTGPSFILFALPFMFIRVALIVHSAVWWGAQVLTFTFFCSFPSRIFVTDDQDFLPLPLQAAPSGGKTPPSVGMERLSFTEERDPAFAGTTAAPRLPPPQLTRDGKVIFPPCAGFGELAPRAPPYKPPPRQAPSFEPAGAAATHEDGSQPPTPRTPTTPITPSGDEGGNFTPRSPELPPPGSGGEGPEEDAASFAPGMEDAASSFAPGADDAAPAAYGGDAWLGGAGAHAAGGSPQYGGGGSPVYGGGDETDDKAAQAHAKAALAPCLSNAAEYTPGSPVYTPSSPVSAPGGGGAAASTFAPSSPKFAPGSSRAEEDAGGGMGGMGGSPVYTAGSPVYTPGSPVSGGGMAGLNDQASQGSSSVAAASAAIGSGEEVEEVCVWVGGWGGREGHKPLPFAEGVMRTRARKHTHKHTHTHTQTHKHTHRRVSPCRSPSG